MPAPTPGPGHAVAAASGRFPERRPALLALAAPLAGEGIEVGPGHQPFTELPAACRVRYVDRYPAWYGTRLFPELRPDERFIPVDWRLDVDRKGLRPIPSASQDFVIASHVIEHVANPLALLSESHRVLRTGGLLVLLVPDRHRTFDAGRAPTPLGHVVDEYRSRVQRVSLDHVRDFLLHTGELPPGGALGQRIERQRRLRRHRRRSVHAHCWDEPEMFELLDWLVRHERHAWQLEGLLAPAAYPDSHEFGYLLRRVAGAAPDPVSTATALAAARATLLAPARP